MPWLPFSLLFIIVSFLLQYFDVRFATRIQLVIILVASAVILVFAIDVIAKGGSEGISIKPFLPSSSAAGLSGLGKGLVFAFLMFTGFEASAVLSEETKDARRVIAVTVLASVGIIIVYFLITVYSEALSYGSAAASDWGADPTPLFTMGAKFGNVALVDVLSVAAIIDAIAVTVACSVTATRMLYAMGRDGILPSALGRTHKTHKTPHIAIYTVLGGSLAYTLVTYFTTDAITRFGFGGGTGSLALILIYLVLSLAAFRLDWGGVTVLRYLVPVVGVALTAYAFYASVYPAPPAPAKFMPYLMLVAVALGLAIGLGARARRVPAILDVDAQVRPDLG